MQLAVLVKGRLRGMGQEAPCEVIATRSIAHENEQAVYSALRLLNAPNHFPDGDYVIDFDASTFTARRRNGEWLIGAELLTEHMFSTLKPKNKLIA